MRKLLLLASFVVAACQPMYGEKAPRVKDPTVVPEGKRKIIAEPEVEKLKPIEDCEFHTSPVAGPKLPKRDMPASKDRVATADTKLAGSDRATDNDSKGKLLKASVEDYQAALQRDPYSAEATLKLAIAYDKALRKGCALKLLDRLAKLAAHPTFEKSATVQIDDVENHKSLFGDYRKEALKAIGRP
jgi:hypothetical protein